MKVKSLSGVWLFVTLWTVAHQTPPSMGFSRQEYGVGCHFLLQGMFLTQGLNSCLPHYSQTLYPLSHQGILSPHTFLCICIMRTFKIYPFKSFQIYYTVLLTIATVLYIRSPELIHLITGSVPFDHHLIFPPSSPFCSFLYFLIGGELLFNAVLVPATHRTTWINHNYL